MILVMYMETAGVCIRVGGSVVWGVGRGDVSGVDRYIGGEVGIGDDLGVELEVGGEFYY